VDIEVACNFYLNENQPQNISLNAVVSSLLETMPFMLVHVYIALISAAFKQFLFFKITLCNSINVHCLYSTEEQPSCDIGIFYHLAYMYELVCYIPL